MQSQSENNDASKPLESTLLIPCQQEQLWKSEFAISANTILIKLPLSYCERECGLLR